MQYQLELGLEGFINGPSGGLCTSDRLALLRARRARWMRLDWERVRFLDAQRIIPVTPLPYEMQGGTFFNVTAHDGGIRVNETRLPSSTHAEPAYATRARERQLVDITTDPAQDLMITLDVLGT